MTANQHENPKWPFPIHNGIRTVASHAVLKATKEKPIVEYVRPINFTFEEALF